VRGETPYAFGPRRRVLFVADGTVCETAAPACGTRVFDLKVGREKGGRCGVEVDDGWGWVAVCC